MSQFEIHSKETAPEGSVPLMEQAKAKFGFVPNLLGGLAEAPAALKGYMTLSGILAESSLSPAEQQILLLTTSRQNGCEYCVAAHTGGATRAGAPKEAIEAIRAGQPIPDPRLQALSKFCATLVEKRGWASEADVNAFLGAGFSKAQVFEVILAIGVKTMSNYANHLIGTPLDEAFKPLAWTKDQAA